MITITILTIVLTIATGIGAGLFRTVGGSAAVTGIIMALVAPLIPGMGAALDLLGVACLGVMWAALTIVYHSLLRDVDQLIAIGWQRMIGDRTVRLAIVIQVA